jgi:predicted transcriptional regulator
LSRVHGFLADHPALGYSAEEVAEALNLHKDTALYALEELAYLGAIEGREVRKGLYFRFAQELRLKVQN